jgi:hypothetical protein
VYIDKFENSDYFFPTLKIIEKYENVNAWDSYKIVTTATHNCQNVIWFFGQW